jgi:hypothetical protein
MNKFTDNVKCEIVKHLSELGAQLRRYFPETVDTNNWIRYPFYALPPVHLPISGLGCAQSFPLWQIALLRH